MEDCRSADCVPDSFGELLLDIFDEDQNGLITVQEIRDDELTRALLAPDLDLYNDDGNYAPRLDGVNDSLSVGLGFTAVPATIVD